MPRRQPIEPRKPYKGQDELQRSAERGEASGLMSMAKYCFEGFTFPDESSIKRNPKTGRHWHKIAAESGVPEGMVAYAQECFKGIGGPRNPPEGQKWLQRAAEEQYPVAQCMLGVRFYQKKKYASALQWLEPATNPQREEPIPEAIDHMALLYINGYAVPKDYSKARELLCMAIDMNYPPSHHHLAEMMRRGQGDEPDLFSAAYNFKQAARQDYPPSLYELAIVTLRGEGTNQSNSEGLSLIAKSADLGYRAAEYTYGCILLEGAFGSEVNVDEGADWIIKAAKRGHSEAQFVAAQLCEEGRGVPYDGNQALVWMNKAADSGHEIAANFRHRPWLGGFHNSGPSQALFTCRTSVLPEMIVTDSTVPLAGTTFSSQSAPRLFRETSFSRPSTSSQMLGNQGATAALNATSLTGTSIKELPK